MSSIFANKSARLAAAKASDAAQEGASFLGGADTAQSGVSLQIVVLAFKASVAGKSGKPTPNEIKGVVMPASFDVAPDAEHAAPTASGTGMRIYITGRHLHPPQKDAGALPFGAAQNGADAVSARAGGGAEALFADDTDPDAGVAVQIKNTSAASALNNKYAFMAIVPGCIVSVKTYANAVKIGKTPELGDVLAIDKVRTGVYPYNFVDAKGAQHIGAKLSLSTSFVTLVKDAPRFASIGDIALFMRLRAPFHTLPFSQTPPLTQLAQWQIDGDRMPARTLDAWSEQEVADEEAAQLAQLHFCYTLAPGPRMLGDDTEEESLAKVTMRGDVACNYGAVVFDTAGDADKFVLPASDGRAATGRLYCEQDVLVWPGRGATTPVAVHVSVPLTGTNAIVASGIANTDTFKKWALHYNTDVRFAAIVKTSPKTAQSKTNKSNGAESGAGSVVLDVEWSDFDASKPADVFVPQLETNLASIVRRRGILLGESGKSEATRFVVAHLGGNAATGDVASDWHAQNALHRVASDAKSIINLSEFKGKAFALSGYEIYVLLLEDQAAEDAHTPRLRALLGAADDEAAAAKAAIAHFAGKGEFALKRLDHVIYAIATGVGSVAPDAFDALATVPRAAAATTTTTTSKVPVPSVKKRAAPVEAPVAAKKVARAPDSQVEPIDASDDDGDEMLPPPPKARAKVSV